MRFRPISNGILVRRVDAPDATSGGIIIPDTAQEKPLEAEVIAVGPGTRGKDGAPIPPEVTDGDHVLLGKWAGTEVTIDNEDYLIVSETDVLGILTSGKAASRAA